MVLISNSNIPLLFSEIPNANNEEASKRVRSSRGFKVPGSGISACHHMPVRDEVVLGTKASISVTATLYWLFTHGAKVSACKCCSDPLPWQTLMVRG